MLCNAAEVRDGLLSVLGGGIIWVAPPAYPHPVDRVLAGLLRIELEEAGDHACRVTLLDQDGAEWGHVDATLSASPDSFGVDGVTTIPFWLALGALSLAGPGDYELPITIDGERHASLWLRAREV